MPVRDTVRDTQRRIAALDAAHTQAVAKLDRVRARRAAALAEEDHLVADAQGEVDRTVADMVRAVGLELTAGVLGLRSSEVRRMAKAAHLATGDTRVAR
jgi:hypothetical protein